MFMMSFFWIIVVGLIVWVVVAATGKKGMFWNTGDSAIEILKKSYARGEISKEEFEARKRELA